MSELIEEIRMLLKAENAILYEQVGSDCVARFSADPAHTVKYALQVLPTMEIKNLWSDCSRCETGTSNTAGCISKLIIPCNNTDWRGQGAEDRFLMLTRNKEFFTGNEKCFCSDACRSIRDYIGLLPLKELSDPPTEQEKLVASVLDYTKRRISRIMLEELEKWRLLLFERELRANLFMQFEPVVDIGTPMRIYGYEALARKGKDSSSFPMEWGETIKTWGSYFAKKFDSLVFRRAIELYTSPQSAIQYPPSALPKLFLNTCVQSPLDRDPLAVLLISLGNEYGFPTNKIVLEIAEANDIPQSMNKRARPSHRMQDYHDALQYLNKKCGIEWALDDWGVEYANAMRMIGLKPRYTKIDADVVRQLPDDSQTIQYVKRVMDQNNGYVIAEGVDVGQRNILELLRRHGIGLVQGHFFSKAAFPPPIVSQFTNKVTV